MTIDKISICSEFVNKLAQLCKEYEVGIGLGVYGYGTHIVVVYKGNKDKPTSMLGFLSINEKGEIKGVDYDN